jgi:predicted  nucleic acid-binding Zn-ribbon protein
MFSEVEKIMEEFKPIAQEYKDMNEKYSDLEDKQYDTEGEIEDFKIELEKEFTKKIDAIERVDEHRCKCCNTVLSKHVTNQGELAQMEKNMMDKIDVHPKVLRMEKRIEKEQAEYKALDERIIKMGDTIYDYESAIKKALEAIDMPDSWFDFHTNLV